jgi:hypothetical protein
MYHSPGVSYPGSGNLQYGKRFQTAIGQFGSISRCFIKNCNKTFFLTSKITETGFSNSSATGSYPEDFKGTFNMNKNIKEGWCFFIKNITLLLNIIVLCNM